MAKNVSPAEVIERIDAAIPQAEERIRQAEATFKEEAAEFLRAHNKPVTAHDFQSFEGVRFQLLALSYQQAHLKGLIEQILERRSRVVEREQLRIAVLADYRQIAEGALQFGDVVKALPSVGIVLDD